MGEVSSQVLSRSAIVQKSGVRKTKAEQLNRVLKVNSIENHQTMALRVWSWSSRIVYLDSAIAYKFRRQNVETRKKVLPLRWIGWRRRNFFNGAFTRQHRASQENLKFYRMGRWLRSPTGRTNSANQSPQIRFNDSDELTRFTQSCFQKWEEMLPLKCVFGL